MVGKTISGMSAILPEPPCPISSIWNVRRFVQGTPFCSSSHTTLQASANWARKSVWSHLSVRGMRSFVMGSRGACFELLRKARHVVARVAQARAWREVGLRRGVRR